MWKFPKKSGALKQTPKQYHCYYKDTHKQDPLIYRDGHIGNPTIILTIVQAPSVGLIGSSMAGFPLKSSLLTPSEARLIP